MSNYNTAPQAAEGSPEERDQAFRDLAHRIEEIAQTAHGQGRRYGSWLSGLRVTDEDHAVREDGRRTDYVQLESRRQLVRLTTSQSDGFVYRSLNYLDNDGRHVGITITSRPQRGRFEVAMERFGGDRPDEAIDDPALQMRELAAATNPLLDQISGPRPSEQLPTAAQ